VEGWFTDDTAKRFDAYGWNVIGRRRWPRCRSSKKSLRAGDTRRAKNRRSSSAKPSSVSARRNKEGKEEAHGAALGKSEVAAARDMLDWRYPPFVIPDEIYAAWDKKKVGAEREKKWNDAFAKYQAEYPELAAEFLRRSASDLPKDWASKSQAFVEKMQADGPDVASRKASQMTLDAFGPLLPELIGGSADLALPISPCGRAARPSPVRMATTCTTACANSV
jgi:transketolase